MLDYGKGCWGYEYVQEAFILIHFLDYDVRKSLSITYYLKVLSMVFTNLIKYDISYFEITLIT